MQNKIAMQCVFELKITTYLLKFMFTDINKNMYMITATLDKFFVHGLSL